MSSQVAYSRWDAIDGSQSQVLESVVLSSAIDLDCAVILLVVLVIVIVGSSPWIALPASGEPTKKEVRSIVLGDGTPDSCAQSASKCLQKFASCLKLFWPRYRLRWNNPILKYQLLIITLAVVRCFIAFSSATTQNDQQCAATRKSNFVMFVLELNCFHLFLVQKVRSIKKMFGTSRQEICLILFTVLSIPVWFGLAISEGNGKLYTVTFTDAGIDPVKVCLLDVKFSLLICILLNDVILNGLFLHLLIKPIQQSIEEVKHDFRGSARQQQQTVGVIFRNVIGTSVYLVIAIATFSILMAKQNSKDPLFSIGAEAVLSIGNVGLILGVMSCTISAWFWKPLHPSSGVRTRPNSLFRNTNARRFEEKNKQRSERKLLEVKKPRLVEDPNRMAQMNPIVISTPRAGVKQRDIAIIEIDVNKVEEKELQKSMHRLSEGSQPSTKHLKPSKPVRGSKMLSKLEEAVPYKWPKGPDTSFVIQLFSGTTHSAPPPEDEKKRNSRNSSKPNC
eukprot:TRINITY_DN24124_c0_g1_i2.p1 TRINITY_DN24124_c0_g1~~TRINITY_DN24124_c0_g1_i2.p1  ORF type:complete len:505 (+),score=105.55 TRINITY_DN24124_c0_g1_i2:129-1643(+)